MWFYFGKMGGEWAKEPKEPGEMAPHVGTSTTNSRVCRLHNRCSWERLLGPRPGCVIGSFRANPSGIRKVPGQMGSKQSKSV